MKVEYLWEKDGPAIITPTVFKDDRGYFFESFNEKEFKKEFGDINFVQDNESGSKAGVIRGIHFQKPPYEQAKLVRVVQGAVFDVAVDLRKNSPTYGQWCCAYLSEHNKRQFFIPRGFGHAFLALTNDTIFQYKCDNLYNKESEGCIKYNDKTINIFWDKWMDFSNVSTSLKDESGEFFKEFESPFKY